LSLQKIPSQPFIPYLQIWPELPLASH
jgi:hypothetical protein